MYEKRHKAQGKGLLHLGLLLFTLAFSLQPCIHAQPQVQTTAYTRYFLLAPDAANARFRLGITGTNGGGGTTYLFDTNIFSVIGTNVSLNDPLVLTNVSLGKNTKSPVLNLGSPSVSINVDASSSTEFRVTLTNNLALGWTNFQNDHPIRLRVANTGSYAVTFTNVAYWYPTGNNTQVTNDWGNGINSSFSFFKDNGTIYASDKEGIGTTAGGGISGGGVATQLAIWSSTTALTGSTNMNFIGNAALVLDVPNGGSVAPIQLLNLDSTNLLAVAPDSITYRSTTTTNNFAVTTTTTNESMTFLTGPTGQKLWLKHSLGVAVGDATTFPNRTNNFLFIPTFSNTPTTVGANLSHFPGGYAPMAFNTNGSQLYVWNAGDTNWHALGTVIVATNLTAGTPSALIVLTNVPGSSTNYMRADAAPALSQAIAPIWRAQHVFDRGILVGTNNGTAYNALTTNGLVFVAAFNGAVADPTRAYQILQVSTDVTNSSEAASYTTFVNSTNAYALLTSTKANTDGNFVQMVAATNISAITLIYGGLAQITNSLSSSTNLAKLVMADNTSDSITLQLNATAPSLALDVAGTDWTRLDPSAANGVTPYKLASSSSHSSGNLLEINNSTTKRFVVENDGTLEIGTATNRLYASGTDLVYTNGPIDLRIGSSGGVGSGPGRFASIMSGQNSGLTLGNFGFGVIFLEGGGTLSVNDTNHFGDEFEVTGTGRFSHDVIVGGATVNSTDVSKLLYIPFFAGVPSGVPNHVTGVAQLYDSLNNNLYIWNGASWHLMSGGGGGSGANPTASIGTSVVNGSSTNFMRSDAAPALDQGISPVWSGFHVFKPAPQGESENQDAFQVTSGTAASVGAQQFSPTFSLEAQGWNPTSSSSKVITARFQAEATQQVSGNPIGSFAIHMTGGSGAILNKVFRVDSLGNVIIGADAAVVTNASNGFLYIPTTAGPPTGTPSTYTGKVPIDFDTTNTNLYIYASSAWRLVTGSGGGGGGGSAPVGTMVESGISTAGVIPMTTDTSGTNYIASPFRGSAVTNAAMDGNFTANKVVVTNGFQTGSGLFTANTISMQNSGGASIVRNNSATAGTHLDLIGGTGAETYLTFNSGNATQGSFDTNGQFNAFSGIMSAQSANAATDLVILVNSNTTASVNASDRVLWKLADDAAVLRTAATMTVGKLVDWANANASTAFLSFKIANSNNLTSSLDLNGTGNLTYYPPFAIDETDPRTGQYGLILNTVGTAATNAQQNSAGLIFSGRAWNGANSVSSTIGMYNAPQGVSTNSAISRLRVTSIDTNAVSTVLAEFNSQNYFKTLGGRVLNRFATSTNYTLTAANHYLIATATCTNSLPAASAVPAGGVFIVKNKAGTTTVRPAGADTIDGTAADDVLTSKISHTYISDGVSNWELN